jgi:hypothetical protein
MQPRQYSFTPLESAMFEQNILINQMRNQMRKNTGFYTQADIDNAQLVYDNMMQKLNKGGSRKSRSNRYRRKSKSHRKSRKH